MDLPSLKPHNSILFKSSSFRTVKYNNFGTSELSLHNCVPEKGHYDPEKGQRKKNMNLAKDFM